MKKKKEPKGSFFYLPLEGSGSSSFTNEGGTQYQPSGKWTSLLLRVHSPFWSVYTRTFARGPSLIGLSSGMNTVLFPQPLINPTTSTTEPIPIHISIERNRSHLDPLVEPVE
jgi:hypothetical protein